MNIKATVDYILIHPFFKQAIDNYNNGNDADLKFLLSEAHIHCWLTVSYDCATAFRKNKRQNDPQILLAIKDIPPPEKLDLRLPIPPKEEDCKVITLQPVAEKQKPSKTKKPPLMG